MNCFESPVSPVQTAVHKLACSYTASMHTTYDIVHQIVLVVQRTYLTRQEVDLCDSSGGFMQSCEFHTRGPVAAKDPSRQNTKQAVNCTKQD